MCKLYSRNLEVRTFGSGEQGAIRQLAMGESLCGPKQAQGGSLPLALLVTATPFLTKGEYVPNIRQTPEANVLLDGALKSASFTSSEARLL